MEDWQKEHIREHLPSLVQNTICNTTLIAHLVSKDFLGQNEVHLMDAMGASDGQYGRTKYFYEIIQTKLNSYEILCEALHKSIQTGALETLLKGYTNNGIPVPQLNDGIRSISDITDETKWNDLSNGIKKEVLSRSVEFQGSNVSLKDVCQNLDHDELFQGTLTGLTLRLLLKHQPIEIINQSLPIRKSYYISRFLKQANVVSTKILRHPCSDVFLIKSIEWADLTRLVNGQSTDLSSEIEELTVRFIVLEYNEDVDEICKKTTNSVHVLEYKNEKLYWEKTRGSVSIFQDFMEDHDDEMDEEAFSKFCTQMSSPVCLSDTPGMGKSFLLENLGRKLINMYPGRLVRFIVMRELVEEVIKSNNDVNAQMICRLIADKCSNDKFGRQLAYSMLISRDVQCELLFDGFDEVINDQIETAMGILEIINKEVQCRIYVTTRPHLKQELENLFCTLGFHIMGFDESNQVNFLVQFWIDNGASGESKLEKHAHKCVESLNKTDFERGIAEIPLQCKLLGEIHLQDAKKLSSGHIGVRDYGLSVKVSSVHQMYEKLMEMRFEKYPHTIRRHMKLALDVILPGWALEFGSYFGDDVDVSPDDFYRVGLVEMTSKDEFRFVHRTFAEYLVGWFVAQILGVKVENLIDIFGTFVFDQVLGTVGETESPVSKITFDDIKPIKSAEFNYPTICYFLNELMKSLKTHVDVQNLFQQQTDLAQIFTAAVKHDFSNIANFLFIWWDKWINRVTLEDLPLLATKHSSNEVLDIVRRMLKLHGGNKIASIEYPSNEGFQMTPLHVAAILGKYKAIEFLLNTCGFSDLIKGNSEKTKFVLYYCVQNSVNDGESAIIRKINIVNLLGKEYPGTLEEKMNNGQTPILASKVHFKLMITLINAKANVNAVDENGKCVLHKVVDIYTRDQYSELVALLKYKSFQHYDLINKNKITPLMAAIQKMEVDEETLKILVYGGGNVNAVDKKGDSVLFHGIRWGRSVEMIKLLIQEGANINHKNLDKRTVLHVAAMYGNLEVLKLFLDHYSSTKQYVNEIDVDLNTPLHLAVLDRTNEHCQISEILIQAGAELNGKNVLGCVPIVHGMRNGKGVGVKLMQLMEKHGLDFKGYASVCLKDFCANLEIDTNEFVEVAKFLIHRGGIVKCILGGSPWDSKHMAKLFDKVVSNTELNFRFISEAANCGLLPEKLKPSSPEEFYNLIREILGSFERVLICLLVSGQANLFGLMRQELRRDNSVPVFRTPVPGIEGSLGDHRIVVISTRDGSNSVQRLKDTLNQDFVVVDEDGLHTVGDLVVVKTRVGRGQEILSKVKGIIGCGKFVIVCEDGINNLGLELLDEIIVIKDEVDFQDLTEEFKGCVIRRLEGEVPNGVLEWVRMNTGGLRGQLLLDILKEVLAGYYWEENHVERASEPIFDYFHPHLFVVKGICLDELKGFCHLGQVVVEEKDFDDREIVDFVVVERDDGYLDVCRKTSRGVHFLKYRNGEFWCVKSRGDRDWVKKGLSSYGFKGSVGCMVQCYENWIRIKEKDSLGISVDWNKILKQNFEYLFTFERVVEIVAGVVCGVGFGRSLLQEIFYNCPGRVVLVVDGKGKVEVEVLRDFVKVLRGGHVNVVVCMDDGGLGEGFEMVGGEVVNIEGLEEVREQFINRMEELIGWGCWDSIGEDCIRDLASIILLGGDISDHLQIGSVKELFERYIQIILGIVNKSEDTFKKNLEYLKKLAVEYIFPGKLEDYVGERDDESLDKELIRVGILREGKGHQGGTVFTYKYVAGYLVSLVYTQNGEQLFENVREMLFQIQEDQVRVSYDLEEEGVQGTIKFYRFQNMPVFLFIKDNISKIFSQIKITEQLVVAAVSGNLVHFCKGIVNQNVENNKFFTYIAVLVACTLGSVRMVELVAGIYEKYTGRIINHINLVGRITCLHAAVRNNLDVLECLEHKFKFKGMLRHPLMSNLLHACVYDTLDLNRKRIQERIKIIKYLLNCNPDLLDSLDEQNLTALHIPRVRVDLMVLLIKLGMNIYVKCPRNNNNGLTFLHYAAQYMNPQDYHKIVYFTYTRMSGKRGANIRALFNSSVLRYALEYLEISSNTLELFKSAGVDFNGVDEEDGRSVLHCAVQYGRSGTLISQLLSFGASANTHDNSNQTVLHYASKYSNLSAARYMIEVCASNVNAKDNNKYTPLHLAFCERGVRETIREIVKLLVEHGADIYAVASGRGWVFGRGGGKTPMDIAMEKLKSGDLENRTVELLKSHKNGVNG